MSSSSSTTPLVDHDVRITLVGAGTIGLSFAALHLNFLGSASQLTILDTRPDLAEYVATTLPKYLPASHQGCQSLIRLTASLAEAVRDADIIQEQGPENLAFALLRESIHLVKEGVVSVEELDRVVHASMGPRWAIAGPFKSYHAGGGPGGLEAFFENIGGTVQGCWDDSGRENVGEGWESDIFRQAKEAYGVVDTSERDRLTRAVLEAAQSGRNQTNS